MKSGRGILAAILSAVLVLSSVQFPAGVSHAEELVQTVQEEENAQEASGQPQGEEQKQEDSGQSQEEEQKQEDSGQSQEEEQKQEDSGQPQEEEQKQEDSEQPQEEEEQEDSGQSQEEEEEQEDSGQFQEDQKEESAEEQQTQDEQVSGNDLQVSGNDIAAVSEQEIWVEAEIEGAYQFGDMPLAGDGIAAYSYTAHSDREIMDYLYTQMKARAAVVNVAGYHMSVEQMERVVAGVLNEHPDLYYVESSYSRGEAGDAVTNLAFSYNDTADAVKWQQSVDAAMATVKPGMSDLQKAIVLHDYLVVNCEYDYENYVAGTIPKESYSTYGVFINGRAVCEGYALSYQYLMELVGIECYMVSGDTSAGAHAWNMIKLDGEYYHVDTTWDDPVPDRLGGPKHEYMFRSDENIDTATGSSSRHFDWQVYRGNEVMDCQATDTRYDRAFWRYASSPLVFDGDDCYYVGLQNTLNKANLSAISDEGTKILSIKLWPSWGDCSGLFQYNNRLYYNDKSSIYSVAMDGTDQRTEFTADTTESHVYGCTLRQGKVLYFWGERGVQGEVLEADIRIEPSVVEEKALNLENLTEQYITVEDTIVSSAAEGKPKLLIFYRYPVYAYEEAGDIRTMKEISGRISEFVGVDIYAIETSGKDKAGVNSCQWKYGCEEMVFSYAVGSDNGDSMWDYVHTAGLTGNISYPVIAYIDADNRLQHVTRAYVPAYTVRRNLEKYCNYQDTYRITYILSGGKNNSANPSFYTQDDTVITLQDPVKEGYQFEGWYTDAAYTVSVKQIYGEAKSDITLYAKWKPIPDVEAAVDQTLTEGNVLIGISGAYYTETAEKILGRLNEIRMEACREGVPNPANPDQPLSLDDYVPFQWSAELEAIARLRAAEVAALWDSWRPNGDTWESVVTRSGDRSSRELLEWNCEGLLACIEQWYGGKNDWANQTVGDEVFTYSSIIDPSYRSVGMSAFRLSDSSRYGVTLEFSDKTNMSTRKDISAGDCVQSIEVRGKDVTKLAFSGTPIAFLREGDTCRLPVDVSGAYLEGYWGSNGRKYTGMYQQGGNWQSSDEKVVDVDSMGKVTALGKGTAQISISVGTQSVSATIRVYGKDENPPITVKSPINTTYKVRQDIDLKGGTVTYNAGSQTKTEDLTEDMISGFDSSKPGICKVNVTVGGYMASFETLIVEEPKLKASAGQKLSEIDLPQNTYGTYTWQDAGKVVGTTGVYTFAAVFTPNDTMKFQKLTDIQVQVTVQETFGDDILVAFKANRFIYNGTFQEPKVVVRSSGAVLKEGQDYVLAYENNRNVGTAAVIVNGVGGYSGEIRREFEILPATVRIQAKDVTILVGAALPANSEYTYETSGLVGTDSLLTEPVISCAVVDTDKAGRYDIVPSGADAGANYTITYGNGRLTVASEYVSWMVSFDMQGHGTAPAAQSDVKAGGTVEKPADPSADGYRFDGWYCDAACTQAWDFDEDIVQADLTLYAKWLEESIVDGGFACQEIIDADYTGKACRPAVTVYDGDILLKSGRDYQIKYYNNINANKDDVMKKGNGAGADFNAELPYVEIIGKGNYTDKIKDGNKDTVKVNFNILRASIGDGTETAAAGVTLRVSDQIATAKRIQKPFSSIKYVKGMKRDVDFRLRLVAENVRDEAGNILPEGTELANAEIPKEYEGEFQLIVEGIGNYTGTIQKPIYVTDKAHLMKNATITIGRDLKNVVFAGEAVELTPSEKNSADTFTVKYGNTFLKPIRDYTVSYRNNDKAGKAELIITGNGEYVGIKTATFNVKGRTFSKKTVQVSGLEDRVYTGRTQTQNGVALTYGMKDEAPKTLQYGTDYTITYTKNRNKGKVTMTFKGMEQAGYSGSFKKTFMITAADIADTELVKRAESMDSMTFPYCKAGVKPVEEIVLTNKEGFVLQNGKDYTLKYQNNKAVDSASTKKPPTVTVQGRGNYAGRFDVAFQITKRGLKQAVDDGSIRTQMLSVAYNPSRAEDYVYKPAVKLKDGGIALREGTDYEIEYRNSTQADYKTYLEAYRNAVMNGTADADSDERLQTLMPAAVIKAKEGSGYEADGEIVVPLPIYLTKLTKSNLQITVAEAVYTGSQVTPVVTVRDTVSEKTFVEGKDYTLTYGTNIKSGKNKGSVTIMGTAPEYGGSVTVKFEIMKKEIVYQTLAEF